MVFEVNATELRWEMSRILGQVQHGKKIAVIAMHGKPIGAIVPMEDLHRIWEKQDDETHGERDPVTGKRPSVLMTKYGVWSDALAARIRRVKEMGE
ncbi:type II toxin-antitoxin system Phd/YefM family antitoxin [Falsihalocynthiibacter arcticus]|uniref:Antitoxin n=1 Tax=Falsihalocynthiibacter arcticus TaxID=1579316 RepID=A0A126UVY6_9RHOB|nr:hypothetical protein [Falsihalocynthiibacter arcticus]AML50238.1 hypothetical protein RC74_02215 [Falsihalocynthiibacter arcticus]